MIGEVIGTSQTSVPVRIFGKGLSLQQRLAWDQLLVTVLA